MNERTGGLRGSVCIAVPVYGVEPYIRATLESILAQVGLSDVPFEILLIDDVSPDESLSVALDYLDTFDEFHVPYRIISHEKNLGLAAVRNTAIAECDSEYLWFVDSDDTVRPLMLQRMIELFDDETDVVATNVVRVDSRGGNPRTRMAYRSEQDWSGEEALQEMLSGHFDAFMVNKLIRSRLYSGIEFPVGRTYEDVAVMGLILARSRRVRFVAEDLYLYYERNDAITSTVSASISHLLLNTEFGLKQVAAEFPDLMSQTQERSFLYRNAIIPTVNLTLGNTGTSGVAKAQRSAMSRIKRDDPGLLWRGGVRDLAILAAILRISLPLYALIYRVKSFLRRISGR